MRRTEIFATFFKSLDKDKINLKQQLFLEKYVEKYYKDKDIIDRLLIYHTIGTGKTRTSIIIAEKIMKINPKMKAIIILPARLKTNYIDELLPLIFSNYNDPKIKKVYQKEIEKKYTIYSYEHVVNLFKKSSNLKKTLEELTKNKILIVDEFHNMISNGIKDALIDNIYLKNEYPSNAKNIRSLLMRFISKYADKTCKMFFLTATPVFDNHMQFIELVKLLNVKKIDDDKLTSFKNIIPYIKGKISYYSINDKDDFPNIEYKSENITLSSEQDRQMFNYQDEDNSQDNETFLVKQRQLAISIYGYEKVDIVLDDLKKYAPKLRTLFKYLSHKTDGKHLIYSNFINYCLYIIKKYLDNNGWIDYLDKNKRKDYKSYKTYVLWDATISDNDKIKVKAILNSKENMDGKIIKVILGSPSIKEGISFKHIQHLHQIDPVWNVSSKQQIEGRCIRYKSHEDIPLNHKYLKRKVIIHNYISVPFKGGLIKKTCDEIIYNDIMPKKEILINKILLILQKVAIDYYLYRKLSTSPKSSSIQVSEDDIKKIKGLRNTCPVKKRPVNNRCLEEGRVIKANNQGFDCCYKELKKKLDKNENNYYNERIKAYKTFLSEFNKCNSNNINNLKLVNQNLSTWTVFKADIKKVPLSITFTIYENNKLFINTIKKLSECVIKHYSPHFQLYYSNINCDDENNKYIELLTNSDSLLSDNYNLTFYENFFYNGNLNDFIVKNKLKMDDKLFNNILTQCILSIIFYYSYFSYKNSEFISLEGILGHDFICHKIKKGGYFKYRLYGKDYYVENMGFIFVLSFINKNSKNSIIKSDNKFDIIFAFIKTIKLFIENITIQFKNHKNNFMEKLLMVLEKCNNSNKQLPEILLAKNINSISSHIIIQKFLAIYKGLSIDNEDIHDDDVINLNNPYIISDTYK